MKKRGMIFIDGSNVYHDWNDKSAGVQMDIEKYIELVKSKFPDLDFLRTYYFTTATSSNQDFIKKVNRLPYCEVIAGRVQRKTIDLSKGSGVSCSNCGTKVTGTFITSVDKGTDVNLAVEMLRHGFNHSFDTAVLISRDADFASVVKIIKSLGCNVELVLFTSAKKDAQELTDCVDRVVTIDASDRKKCEMSASTTATATSAPAATTTSATTTAPTTTTSPATTTAPAATTTTSSSGTSAVTT